MEYQGPERRNNENKPKWAEELQNDVTDIKSDVRDMNTTLTYRFSSYEEVCKTANEANIRSKHNEESIGEIKNNQLWLTRAIALMVISWVFWQIFPK